MSFRHAAPSNPARPLRARRAVAATLCCAIALGPTGPGTALAQAVQACPALPAREAMPREARPEYMDEAYWRARVAELSRIAGRDMSYADMIFFGDSIVHGWHLPVWEQYYGRRGGVNFGVGGDFVQGLLWRLRQGGQWPDSLRPKLAVIMIGTNNSTYAAPPADTALGIAEIVRLIRQRAPATRILLVGILPRGLDASDPGRRLNQRVNELIMRCADNRWVFYTDVGPALLDRQGHLSPRIAADGVHPTAEGYSRLAAALEPVLGGLLAR